MSDDPSRPVSALREKDPWEKFTQSLIPFPKKRLSYLYLCAAMIPRGKAPAPGRLVFPQICRPSREPKINMRKTTRINLAACAEKLGVSMIALSHTSEKKGSRRRKIAERQQDRDEGNKQEWRKLGKGIR